MRRLMLKSAKTAICAAALAALCACAPSGNSVYNYQSGYETSASEQGDSLLSLTGHMYASGH